MMRQIEYERKLQREAEEKERLARAAMELIVDRQSVMEVLHRLIEIGQVVDEGLGHVPMNASL